MALIDVERVRRETAGVARVVHLNNAGASLPPRPVVDAVIGHLRLEEQIGGYEAAAAQAGRIEHTYDALARLVGAGRDDIAVVENATRAWDMAFHSLPWAEGDRILTARAEYASNAIAFLQTARRHGVRVDVVPDDAHGQLDVDALRAMVDERVRLIAITHVPTQGGLVNPAAEIGEVARQAGVVYLLDACQSIGQMPVDVGEIGCDLLTATGRKFLRAPRGTGFLYCSPRIREQLEPPFLDLHAATWTSADGYQVRGDARRFENWETYCAGKIGLGTAVDYALDLGLDAIGERVTRLAATLRARLRTLPGVRVHDRGVRQCGIVTFTVEGHDSQDVARALRAGGINVSVSVADHARWDFEPRSLTSVVRASVHYYNTDDEIDRLVDALPAPA
ncbi:aminotransferase class V-fold PLP-dependent enzyme [Streptacidiphilus sp. ASG 303]|uniref:aminotransferase class V-fold PLP-dependent enzyme n=1 Tax=Streptacidiphilus sp. ASG 303 TaxID=2896847 RepID=UPI001E62C381|nr:aminotransferase class V-fold PLP-dependent enzyme [Streptacidiphilus sp. ASG 303]MCD0483607.1 aminotransferase class V-fold PLP-dependent enzyme [Streptacidiphilus sp. ASG 303]